MFKYPLSLVAGQGLGISYSSLNQIGDILPSRACGQSGVRAYANVANGNLVVTDHIYRVMEQNGPLEFYFVYNLQAATVGSAWRFAAGANRFTQLSPSNRTAVLTEVDGHETVYTYDESLQVYLAPGLSDGIPYLKYDSAQQQWIHYHPVTQITTIYDKNGFLIKRSDAFNRTTTFGYDNQGNVSSVKCPSGTEYLIQRKDQRLYLSSSYLGDTQLLNTYVLDNQGRLLSSTTYNYQVNYSYQVEDTTQLKEITQSDGTVQTFYYRYVDVHQAIDRIASDGHATRFTFDNLVTSVSDPNKVKTKITCDQEGHVVKVDRENGYVAPNKVIDTTLYEYTSKGQLQLQTDPDQGVTQYTYHSPLGLCTRKVEPQGQTTDYFYDTSLKPKLYSRVQYLSRELGDPIVTRYVYDETSSFPTFVRFEVSPEGRVIEYTPDEKGNIKSERRYLNAFMDVSHIAPNQPLSMEEIKSWLTSISKDNKQQTSLKDYRYDHYGQRIETKTYAKVNKDGTGEPTDEMSDRFNFKNVYGSLEGIEVWQGGTDTTSMSQKFDDLQRLLRHKDFLKNVTEYVYLDKESQIKITHPNGREEVQQYDKQGLLTSKQEIVTPNGEQPITRTTNYQLDNGGRPIVITHPDKTITINFFDMQNRLGYTISPLGHVTFEQEDAQHRFKMKVDYNYPIDVAKLFVLPDFPPIFQQLEAQLKAQDHQFDRISYEFYDLSGRLHYTVDADLFVTEYQYDNLNRQTAKFSYSNPLTSTELDELKQGKAISLKPNPETDRWWRYSYDKDGNQTTEQDPGGFVTEKKYDAGGRCIEISVHTTQVDHDENLNTLLSQLHDDAINTYYFYNAHDQCIMEVDAKNYVTTYDYYHSGLKKEARRYANKLNSTWREELITDLPLLPLPSPEDQVTSFQYDASGRLIQTHLPFNKIAKKAFDVMGDLTLAQEYDGKVIGEFDPDTKRSQSSEYDGFQQLIQASEHEDVNQESNHYHYDNTGLKVQSINPLNATTSYYYDNDRRPIVSIGPNGLIIENTLNSFNEIIATRRYHAAFPVNELPLPGGFMTKEFRSRLDSFKNDALDAITYFERNKRGLVVKVTDPENYVSEKTYDAFKKCKTETKPIVKPDSSKNIEAKNYTISHEYEPRGLEIKTTRSAQDGSLVTIDQYEYNNPLGKMTAHTDPLDNRTQYIIDSLGNRTETIDPEMVVREKVDYDAFARPSTVENALKQVTRHEYDQEERTDTVYSPVAGTTDVFTTNIFSETIKQENGETNSESWQHESSGKITKHTDLNGKVTEDKFDAIHQRIRHIDANQVNTQFVRDLSGNVTSEILDPEGKKLTTTFKRDNWGLAIEITDPRLNVTAQSFDKRDLLTATIIDPIPLTTALTGDHLNIQTTLSNNGQKTKTNKIKGDIQTENQNEKAYIQDGLNRDVCKIIDPVTPQNPQSHALNLQTQKRLNLAGKTIAVINEHQGVTYYFYDACGRERFSVNPVGGVIENQYDLDGNRIYQREYNTPLTQAITETTTLEQMTFFAAKLEGSLDSQYRYFFDANHKERFRVTSQGSVREKRYNNVPYKVATLNYYHSVNAEEVRHYSLEELVALMKTLENKDKDSITHKIVDGEGRPRFIIDPEGYVLEKRYDAVGNVITEILFADAVADPAAFAKLPVDSAEQHLNLQAPDNRFSYWVFDERNNPQYQVFPEGNVVFYKHDANGNLIAKCYFEEPLTDIPSDYDALVAKLKSLDPDANPKNQIYKYEFDAANRKVIETDPKGNSDIYTLSAVDTILTHKDRNYTDTHPSIWNYLYDRAKREEREISPATTLTTTKYNPEVGTTGALIATQSSTPESVSHTTSYDKETNTITVTHAAGTEEERVVKTHFDLCNRAVQVELKNVAIDNPDQNADFKNPPEVIKAELAAKTIYNGKNKPIVTTDEEGNLSFMVYDSENRCIFMVDTEGCVIENQYNALNQVEKEIKYATKLGIDLSEYAEKGIPPNVITDHIKKSPEDRTTLYEYDRRGDVHSIKRGPLFYYCPSAASPESPHFGMDFAQHVKEYNAARECYRESKLINPTTKIEETTLYWHNRNGKLTAKVDPALYVTIDTYNTFDKIQTSVEYSNPLLAVPKSKISVADLERQIIKNPDKDRIIEKSYDLCGLISRIKFKNVTYEVLASDTPEPTLLERTGDLTVEMQYSKTGKQVALVQEDGSTEYTYYDLRDLEIAKADVPRETYEPTTGNKIVLIPLTYFGVNVEGKRVLTTRFQSGTAKAEIGTVPSPKAIDPSVDQTQLIQMSKRGKPHLNQDGEGNLFGTTFTATGKTARTWHQLSNWKVITHEKSDTDDVTSDHEDKDVSNTIVPDLYIDEKRFVYDGRGLTTHQSIWRSGKFVQTTIFSLNAFGEAEQEGPDGVKWPLQRSFDCLGHVWRTNEGNGAYQIMLQDLRGYDTVTFKTPTQDFAAINYSDLGSIAEWSLDKIEDIERTEKVRDQRSDIVAELLPAYLARGINQALSVPLSIQVEKRSKDEETHTWLTWVVPQERNCDMHFTLNSETHPTIVLLDNDTRCGVDVSELTTDNYAYTISYTMELPSQEVVELYKTTGKVQFDTGKQAQSKSVVIQVNEEETLQLSGKVQNLVKIQLWQNNEKINEIPVSPELTVDLSQFSSGTYTLIPVYTDSSMGEMSLPFTIYTSLPSPTPLAREINFAINLSVDDGTGAQVHWTVNKAFEDQPIKISCDYLGQDQQHYTDEATIDKKQPTMTFTHPVQAIQTLSVQLRIHQGQTSAEDIWIPMMIGISPDPQLSKPTCAPALAKCYLQGFVPAIPESIHFEATEAFSTQEALLSYLNTNKAHVINVLYALMEEPSARVAIADEIFMQLKDGKFVLDDPLLWMSLNETRQHKLEDFHQATFAVTAVLGHPISQIDSAQLKEHLVQEEQQELYPVYTAAQKALAEAEEKLIEFCQRKALCEEYINAFNKTELMSYRSLQLYADTQHIPLAIWQRSLQNPTQLMHLENSHDLKKASEQDALPAIHLLLNEVSSDFHPLAEVGFRKLPAYPYKRPQVLKETLLDDFVLITPEKVEDDWVEVDEKERSNSTTSSPKTIRFSETVTAYFSPRTIISFSPLQGVGPDPMVTFLDMTLDRFANEKILSVLGVNTDGIVVDVTDMAPCRYPCTIGSYSHLQFTIGTNTVYPSNDYPENIAPLTHLTSKSLHHPKRVYQTDAWHNIIKSTNALGYTTDYDFNFRNQNSKIIHPEVEYVDETGNKASARPVVKKGHNELGSEVGIVDPRNYTTGYEVNAAHQVLKTILADGSIARLYAVDALSSTIGYRDERNFWWLEGHDRNSRQTSLTYPSKTRFWLFRYNELGKRSLTEEPGDRIYHLNYDANSYESAHLLPSGLGTYYTRDRNGQAKMIQYSDGTLIQNHLDYFGVTLTHRDLGGAVETLIYDQKRQNTGRVGAGGNHGSTLLVSVHSQSTSDGIKWVATTTKQPVSPQHIVSTYQVGRLIKQDDVTLGKTSLHYFDEEGQLVERSLIEVGHQPQMSRTQLDALSRETFCFDHQLTLNIDYDLADNRVHLESRLTLVNGLPLVTESRWNTYTKTNNIVIDGGKLEDGHIRRGKGRAYGYQGGLRVSESHLLQVSNLSYDSDNFLIGVTQGEKSIHRTYNTAMDLKHIKVTTPQTSAADDAPGDHVTSDDVTDDEVDEYLLFYDVNGWQKGQLYKRNEVSLSSVNFPNPLNAWGQPTRQTTVTHSYNDDHEWVADITDTLTHQYVEFDEPKIHRINGTREVKTKDETKSGDYTSVSIYPDSNGATSVITGQQNAEDPKAKYGDLVLLQTTTEGLILSKKVYHHYGDPVGMDIGPATTNFFTVNDHYLGNYDTSKKKLGLGYLRSAVTDWGGQEVGVLGYWKGRGKSMSSHPNQSSLFSYADPVDSVVETAPVTESNPHPGLVFTFPPPMPSTYSVMQGDQVQTISERLYGNSSFSEQIESANGIASSTSLYTGYAALRLPPLVPTKNQSGQYGAYEVFVSQMMSRLAPHLTMPKLEQQPNLWSVMGIVLVEAIAIAVGVAIAPELMVLFLGKAAIGTLLGISTQAAIAGVTAGLIDMTGQELQLAIGIRDKFSWGEVGSVAIAATLESGMQGIEQVAGYGTGVNAGVHLSEQMQLVERIVRSGALSSAQQLTEMAAGLRHKFDVRLVGSAILNTLSTDKITHLNLGRASVLSMPLSTMTTSLITPVVMGQRFNAGVIAAQVMGQIAGNELGGALGSGAREYLRSQQQSINQRQSAAYPNPSRTQSKTLPEPSMANRDKVRRWQEEQSVTRRKNWGRLTPQGWEERSQKGFEPLDLPPVPKSMEDWQRSMGVQLKGQNQVQSQSGFWEEVEAILEMDYGVQQGFAAGLTFSPIDTSKMGGWQKTGVYFGEAAGVFGSFMTGEAEAIGLLKAAELGRGFLAGSRGLARDSFSKLVDGVGVWGTTRRVVSSAESIVNTGGRQLKTVRASIKADEDAVRFYENIRSNPLNHDVSLIAKNSGMPEFQVQRIKQHLFFDTHKLATGIERFAPDIEIADAWSRLQAGSFVKQDLQLLQHEYFEARFEGIFKTDYITAHNAANDSLRQWNPYEFVTTPEMSWRP